MVRPSQGFVASTVVGGAHVRRLRSVSADVERRVLVWIAERTPTFINSDHLTLLGLLAMVAVGVAFAAAAEHPRIALPCVPVLLGLNWLGDSLDGTLARVRGRQRPRYGFYVDHAIDLVGSICLFAGLALSGFMHPTIALMTLAAFLLLSAESYLTTYARGVFNMSVLGWGPTELRVLLSVGALALLGGGSVRPFGLGPFRLFDVGGLVGTLAMGAVFVVLTVRNARGLYREETTWR